MNTLLLALALTAPLAADGVKHLEPLDVFQLEFASDPQISPDGSLIVYVRAGMDIMRDSSVGKLWVVSADGSDHRPLTASSDVTEGSPRWSPDGKRLLFVSSDGTHSQIFCRWMDTGATSALTRLTEGPGSITWSPDGRWIAFSMNVAEEGESLVPMPPKPEGAEWADPPKVITSLAYRSDGRGYLEPGHDQIFIVPADGGSPRQLTEGPFDHGGPFAFSPDGGTLWFSANRREDAEFDPLNSELYTLDVKSGEVLERTDRPGPDHTPVLSPDGTQIAWLGFDDQLLGYHTTRLWVMDTDGSRRRTLTGDLDRSVQSPTWSADGSALYVSLDDRGNTQLLRVPVAGGASAREILARDIGGTSLGRPYDSGSYSVSVTGRFAYTHSRPEHPADVAIGPAAPTRDGRLTRLNDDLLAHKTLGKVEELTWPSSHDGLEIQGWLVYPPDFDATQSWPLLLEIHGGPFANYGDRFSAEIQLYAAAGYVVLYTNPRGSTSYGADFANEIHHAYPGNDYHDLMSGVDAVLSRGFVDPERLYVTGGSGGGVLTAWIVGKTDRFAAAVVAKPVIHWTSFALTADAYAFFYKYWFPGFPWDHQEHYWSRSPLSLVGNVSTPTALLTGEQDWRTPISESEQYYQALKLRRIDTALIRIPGASHGIARRPSQLIAKVLNILAWFERYGGGRADSVEAGG